MMAAAQRQAGLLASPSVLVHQNKADGDHNFTSQNLNNSQQGKVVGGDWKNELYQLHTGRSERRWKAWDTRRSKEKLWKWKRLTDFTKEYSTTGRKRQRLGNAFVIGQELFVCRTHQDKPGESVNCLHAFMFMKSSVCIQVKHEQIWRTSGFRGLQFSGHLEALFEDLFKEKCEQFEGGV